MAYVLSSISGNLISAASAGYAPTNSGDVSAIASAYQVVSSTATQLYAGTAYVTSINDAPISAARAGNAANASMATSAYYDGTGRLISALPDSTAVSAIASSYVESGVSSKQDTLSFAYNTADQISSINGSALGGMDEAAVSGIASAYAESAVSSVSSNYYTTANESGYALSSNVSATVDLVSTQSANWGGSALALSAGPGVSLTKVGDTLVASTDETVLWSGDYSVAATSSLSLAESWRNFDYIKVLGYWNENDTKLFSLTGEGYTSPFTAKTGVEIPATTPGFVSWGDASAYWVNVTIPCIFTSTAGVKVESARLVGKWNNAWQAVNTVNGNGHIVKIVGINRTAEA